MSDAAASAESNSADPLKTAADAMALAAQAARDGASDARARVATMAPAVGEFLSRFTYTTFYTISYGVVFPSLLLARAVPQENALVHGLIDGGRAARDAVTNMKKKSQSEAAAGEESAAGGSEEKPEPEKHKG